MSKTKTKKEKEMVTHKILLPGQKEFPKKKSEWDKLTPNQQWTIHKRTQKQVEKQIKEGRGPIITYPKDKKAGGGLLVPREGYAKGKIVADALGRAIGKAGKQVLDALSNKERFRDTGDLELRQEAFDEYVDEINNLVDKTDDIDDLNEIHETLQAEYHFEYGGLYEDDFNNKLITQAEAEKKIDDHIDEDIPDFTSNIMEKKSELFRKEEGGKGQQFRLFAQEGGMPVEQEAGGSLMVPREGLAVGSLVKKGLERVARKVFKILKKKDTLRDVPMGTGDLSRGDAYDIIDDDLTILANESTSEEIDEIFSLLENDIVENLVRRSKEDDYRISCMPEHELDYMLNQELRDQYPNFYEAFKEEDPFGGSVSKQTNLSQLGRDRKILQKREEMENPSLRKKKQEGGIPVEQDMPVDTYPNIPPEEMAAAEASQLPDDEMEDEFIDFILDESLNDEEQTYLMNSLEADPQLSIIFDKIVGVASEFSGAGEVEGPGTGVSDSIPARLSDGEFVMTRKATDSIGPDNLQSMMDEAEMAYDIDGGRELKMAFGGVIKDQNLEEDSSKDYLSQTDEEIRKVMIGSDRMPSVR